MHGVSDTYGATACTTCTVAGRVPNNNASACDPCPLGTFQPTAGATACLGCPTRPSANSGATACLSCSAGSVFNLTQGRCAPCSPGYVYNVENSIEYCTTCSAYHGLNSGYYNPLYGATTCMVCASGYQPDARQQACKLCGAGTGWDPSVLAGTCRQCSRGMWSDGNTAQCQPCPPGKFAPGLGTTACAECPLGTYGNSSGVSACTLCEKGTFSNTSKSPRCLACDATTYADVKGSARCWSRRTSCGPGKIIRRVLDPTANDECDTCKPCVVGQYFLPLAKEPIMVTPEDQSLLAYCTGLTYEPPYTCVPNTPVAGFAMKAQMVACPPLNSNTMAYVAGPYMTRCYVGCMYGFTKDGREQYVNQTAHDAAEDVQHNAFLQEKVFATGQTWNLCTTCPLNYCKLPGKSLTYC